MRFGGHQTFPLRDGWLYKGLSLLMNETERDKLVDPNAFDYLGVGRNMAKAINHWLLATGLAKKKVEYKKDGKEITKKDLENEKLAQIIWKYDKYFSDPVTWWFLHINLINNPENAATWHWFFNYFNIDRFQRDLPLHMIYKKECSISKRNVSEQTLARDLACFFSTYSKEIPASDRDPEDETESPFVELGLMNYYKNSGYFHLNREEKSIPLEVFLFAIAKTAEKQNDTQETHNIEYTFFDLMRIENSPSKVFLLSSEQLFELIMNYTSETKSIKIQGLAGERIVNFTIENSDRIAESYYKRINNENR